MKNHYFNRKRVICVLFLNMFLITVLNAVPHNGLVKHFKQPNGSSVDVKLFGTEFYMRGESIDGYSVIRDKKTGWICYATLSTDGSELVSTGIRYSGEFQKSTISINGHLISKHLDVNSIYREKQIAKNRKLAGLDQDVSNAKTAPHVVSGLIKGLCIVVDFSDEPGTLPITEFENFCNNLTYSNYGNNGSLRKLYFDYSGGVVDYQNVVYGYFRAPLTFAEYDQMEFAQGAQQILGLALNWVASLGFDFSTLTTNPDGSITAINLMYTGDPPNWAEGMWFHQGGYSGFSANGVHSGLYNCSPATEPLGVAVVAHENGHMIGQWPDTYKYTSDTGPDGIGGFDLMCWYGDTYNPVPPNPHFVTNAGWGNVVDVTYFNGIISDTANSLTIYKYTNPNDTNEFFLIKNRMQEGRSLSIPDQGLTIWHIDRNGDNQTTHHETYLAHANNNIEDHYDACFHLGFNAEFGSTSTPNSNYYNQNPSALRVWDISNYGNVMTYKIGAGQPAPSFLIQYLSFINDPNNNGFLEPAESGDLNVQIRNLGQLNSDNATITCTAIDANASYVTVNTPSVPVGVVAVNQIISSAFNISLASNIPIGSVITFKFLISDGSVSTFITKQIMVGQQIIVGESPAATCSAIFADNGGISSNYPNNTTQITTLTAPQNSKVRVQFLEFDLEESSNCVYDYLKIYDGINVSAPLIGTYCGATSPETITATNASGALTFKFRADEGVTGTGWKSLVTCVPSSDVQINSMGQKMKIAPNPFNEYTTVRFSDVNLAQSSLKIVDLLGNIVLEINNLNTNSCVIDKSMIASGVYFVKLFSNNQWLDVQKIILY